MSSEHLKDRLSDEQKEEIREIVGEEIQAILFPWRGYLDLSHTGQRAPRKCLFCGTPQDVESGAKFVKARDCGCAESRHHIDNCDSLGCDLADAEPGDCSYERFNRLYQKAHGDPFWWLRSSSLTRSKTGRCRCATSLLMTSGCQCGAIKDK